MRPKDTISETDFSETSLDSAVRVEGDASFLPPVPFEELYETNSELYQTGLDVRYNDVDAPPEKKPQRPMSDFPEGPLTLIILPVALLSVVFGAAFFSVICAFYEVPIRMVAEEGSLLSTGGEMLGSARPSSFPSASPSMVPTVSPSSSPTANPSAAPSVAPSLTPSASPSLFPSVSPSQSPTAAPTSSPSQRPSRNPTSQPSKVPTASPSSAPTDTPVVFYVMGDVPYNEKEAIKLRKQVDDIPNDADFVVHVGDINRPEDTNCTANVYSSVRSLLRRSNHPVFIVPGDNDIRDCPNPFIAKQLWRQNFLSFDANWRKPYMVRRQTGRFENFSFFLHNVLFVGVDFIDGGRIMERASVLQRDLDWILGRIRLYKRQMSGLVLFGHSPMKSNEKEFWKPLAKEIKSIGVPTLYIHGNGHKYEREKRAMKVRNMVRVQVDNGGDAEPLRVRFRGDAKDPFEFDRRK